MTDPAVSVVVVSRGRPDALARCLRAICQLRHDPMEVVVVADPDGIAAVAPWENVIKTVPCDEANISAARNLGIAAVAGEIVAFIDDDAVPEPSWLQYLVTGFGLPDVVAAGGYVRGRNGISFQWKAQAVDVTGQSIDLTVPEDAPSVPEAPPGYVVRTQGTNMAFRRAALVALGGFDPAFRFYLDESELHLRLAATGGRTAIVPKAEVHHGFLAGPYRHASRLPRSLWEPYGSHAVLMRKHAPERDVFETLLARDRIRLNDHLIRGTCEPRDIRRLLASARDGWAEGLARPFGEMPDLGAPPPAFRPLPTAGRTGPTTLLAGRTWQAARLRRQAAEMADAGETVTLFLFEPSARYHHMRYRPEGYWEQTGGLFGRADRRAPIVQLKSFNRRLRCELTRINDQRLLLSKQ